MEKPLWQVAFEQCRARIVAGTDLPIHEESLERFLKNRDKKFEDRLDDEEGEERWRLEGPTIRKWASLIGTLAELEALFEPETGFPYTVHYKHLQRAFDHVNDKCTVIAERLHRAEYC